ncbi:MAG: hypothetical protein KF850_05630 [Labilithrix sp.]|nr:hypothetical protein [Labilithrix sp.]MBX3211493.1 hypothetical protein [Labilithrix sp.]
MPYRAPGRQRPTSPDVDENLLAMPWFSRALLFSLVYTPLLMWVIWMTRTGTGPRELTLTMKVAVTIANSLWLAALSILRARHQRRMRAVLAKLEERAPESPRARIAASSGATVTAIASDPDEHAATEEPEHVERSRRGAGQPS